MIQAILKKIFLLISFLILFTGVSAAETLVSGTISTNTTWDLSGSPYIVMGDIYVYNDTMVPTLIIDAGVTVNFSESTRLNIGGAGNGGILKADNVLFTGSNQAKGWWKGIYFNQNSEKSYINNSIIEYGGLGDCYSWGCTTSANVLIVSSSLDIYNSMIADSSSYGIYSSGNGNDVRILSGQISGNDNYGIYITGSGNASIMDSQISDNIGGGVYLDGSSFSSVVIENNTITNSSDHPLTVSAAYIEGVKNNTLSLNTRNEILLSGGTISDSAIMRNQGIPYRIIGDINVYSTTNTPTLIIESGLTLNFTESTRLNIGGAGNGSVLKADNVLFTGSNQTRGWWKGIYFNQNSEKSYINNSIIEYGGQGDCYSWGCTKGANVLIASTSIDINNSIIANSSSYGIYSWGSGHDVKILNDQISRNENHGLYFIEGSNVTIRDNQISDNIGGGAYLDGSSFSSVAIENNNINSSSNYPLTFSAMYIENVQNNIFTANNPDEIQLSGGTIPDSAIMRNQGIPYRIIGDINVYSTTNTPTLIIESGLTLNFTESTRLNIGGAGNGSVLKADNVLFTGSNQTRGWWKGIYFNQNSEKSYINNSIIEYGGQGDCYYWGCTTGANVNIVSTSMDINNSLIANSNGYGISSSGIGNDIRILNDLISENQDYGLYFIGNYDITIKGDIISNNSGGGAYFDGFSFSSLVIENNSIIKSSNYPLTFSARYIGSVKNNIISENIPDEIRLSSGTISDSATLRNQGIPYRIIGDIYVFNSTSVPILSIDAGVTLNFTESTSLNIGGEGNGGVLKADNVLFTGSNQARGWWKGIYFYQNSEKSYINNSIIEYGGQFFCDIWGCQIGANVHLTSTSIDIINSTVTNSSSYGIYSSGNGNDVMILGDRISDNENYGLYFKDNNNVTIRENQVSNNHGGGIYMKWISQRPIINNNISNNENAIYLESSSNNTFYFNSFSNNTINVRSANSRNIWESSRPIAYKYNGSEHFSRIGNYWSDYSGSDSNGDGIGDTIYNIDLDKDHYPLIQSSNSFIQSPTATELIMNETASSNHTLFETIISQNATLITSVNGDLNGTLNFSNLEFVLINSGSFAGKGFSEGNWTANIEGSPHDGYWQGMLFKKPGERKIYLKGVVSGDFKGIVEGYLIESFNGSDVYDQYLAKWTINQIGADIVYARIELNGTANYQDSSEYSSELYALQTSIEGEASGHYNGSLSVVLTHVRIDDETKPYYGKGFSIFSYVSQYGTGEGWTHDRLIYQGRGEMKGLFDGPLSGIVSAAMDKTETSRSLSMNIERIDIGLPPAPDLKVKIWGLERVSPGQTVDYIIEYRNDGQKAAENVDIINKLSPMVKYVSNSGNGIYKESLHEVRWHLDSIPTKTKGYFIVKDEISWGLQQGTPINQFILIPKEPQFQINPDITINSDILEVREDSINLDVNITEQNNNLTIPVRISFREVSNETKPTFEYTQEAEKDQVKFTLTQKVNPLIETFFIATFVASIFIEVPLNIKLASETEKARLSALDSAYKSGFITFDDYARLLIQSTNIGTSQNVFTVMNVGISNAISSLTNSNLKKFYIEAISRLADNFGIPRRFLTLGDEEWWVQLMNSIDAGARKKFQETLIDQMKKGGYLEDADVHISEIAVARDPNIKYGYEGFVFSGQKLNYTVEFENEGDGIAFGVYFTDTLDEDLDASTLEIGPVISTIDGSIIAPSGTYYPSIRTITWLVGEVGPGEGGYANISVDLRNNADEGTEIINYGTVYFPSVPETTRTNGIISVVDITPPKYSKVNQNKSVVANGEINEVYTYWQDGVQINSSWLETNESGTWQNVSFLKHSAREAWSNFSIQTTKEGVTCWRIHANDTARNSNSTPVLCLDVQPSPIPPVARCGEEMLKCENAGTKVQFNGTSSYDPDGTIRSYFWEFGDGSNGTGAAPVHAYGSYKWNGTAYQPFMVNLSVTDDSSLMNSTSQNVVIWMAGDANGDGRINILDASVVGLKWGSSDPCADLNNDGIVNILDASIIGLNWGKIAIT